MTHVCSKETFRFFCTCSHGTLKGAEKKKPTALQLSAHPPPKPENLSQIIKKWDLKALKFISRHKVIIMNTVIHYTSCTIG
jgi:hypothetical protein